MTTKESEEDLKGFKKKYEKIIKHLDIGYFKADANGIILDHNPSFRRIFGYEPNESLVGFSATELWANPEDFNNYLKEITEKGKLGSYIHKARKKNGELIVLHSHSHVYKNKEKNTFEAEGTIFDISEKYFLEQKLKESEKNYRNIIENAQDAIVIFGLDGNLKYISPQLSKMLGREIELGTRAFDGIHPDDQKVLVEAFKKAVREKRIYTNEELEFRAIHNDGHYIWLSSLTKNYYGEEGNLDGFIALLKDITDKKEAQTKLLESEKKYQNIIENSKDAIVIIGLDGKFKYVSPQLSKIMGKEVNLKTALFDDIHPEDIDKLKELFFTAVKEKRLLIGQDVEFRTLHNDGDYIWLSSSSKSYYDDKGNLIGFITLLRDVTDKKEAEHKLIESETKYREILDNLEQGYYEVDLGGNYTLANVYLAEFYETTPDEMIGKNYKEFINKEAENNLFKVYNQIYRESIPKMTRQFDITGRDGLEHTFELIIYLKRDSNGKKVGFYGTLYDISERRKWERKLEESEERYRTLFESSPNAITLINMEGNIVDCNPSTLRIFGYEKEELLGIVQIDSFFPQKFMPLVMENFKKLMKGIVPEPHVFPVHKKDGSLVWSLLQPSLVKIGGKTFIQHIIQDITDIKESEDKLKKSEEELKRLNKELEQKVKERTRALEEKNLELEKLDKAKDDFITMAAHELKTPLISIAGYTDYILTKHIDDLSLEIKNDLLIVQRNIKRLQTFMNQLLDVMKIESHKIELKLERTKINDIIYECLNELNYLIKEKNHEMILNIDNEIFLNVDSNRIFQVFSNLISNATKFTQKNGRIEITAKKDDKHYLFEIKDNGIGLPEKDLERIFKKFETIEKMNEAYNQTGTGIGLYISKGFIEAHGGKMWATSEGLNKGMSIHFTIPI
ncbi:MAG: PAS domain-containing sensor histidine kinase [Promethearchaeota archaeon]|nr:MAG: PAS domain-containing sensor histidine kinase [Candidatus Lokiarchaeota archaeon]